MESWVVGYEGNDDVERHAGTEETLTPGPSPVSGREVARRAGARALHIRLVSDYI